MDLFEAITSRKRTHKFKKDPVDDRLIGVALYSASNAHSAGETQEWHFVVVKDEKIKEKLSAAALDQPWIKDAPVDIVVCADLEKICMKYGKRGEVLYSVQDTAAASMLIILVAHWLGLGSDWVRAFDEEKVKEILVLPDNLRPMSIIPVGYSAETLDSERIPFENVTHVDRYGKKYDASYITQAGRSYQVIKPLGNQIEDAMKKFRKEKKLSFKDFLKRFSSKSS